MVKMNKIEKVQKAVQQALGVCDFSGLSPVKVHLLRAMSELKKIEEKKKKSSIKKEPKKIGTINSMTKSQSVDSLGAIEKMIESESSSSRMK
jgi:hypothetical protein